MDEETKEISEEYCVDTNGAEEICDIKEDKLVVSIKEYRQLLGDKISTDGDIVKRLQYLEAFCFNIVRLELNKISE